MGRLVSSVLQYLFKRGTKNIHSHICKKITIFQQCAKRLFFYFEFRSSFIEVESWLTNWIQKMYDFLQMVGEATNKIRVLKLEFLGFFSFIKMVTRFFFSWRPHQKIKITCRRKIVHAHCRVQEKKIISFTSSEREKAKI